jgi:NhaP-type Na+/H+ or K+/H+ antiporter
MSGIVAILINGLFLNLYATPNITRSSRKVLKITYETIAYSAETLVFIFLGIGVFAFEHDMEKIGIKGLLLSIINFNIARFLNIRIVTFFVNKSRSE